MLIELFKNTIYIRIGKDRMVARSIESKQEYQARPFVALNGKKSFIDGAYKLLAVGDEALSYRNSSDPTVKVVNAFLQEKTVISDFDIAVATLRHFVSKISSPMKIVRPIFVLHPLEIKRDITPDEIRTLREAGISAGARKVLIWIGRELFDHELEKLKFPKEEGKLFDDPVKSFKLIRP